MQLQKSLNSVAHRISISSAFAIDVSGCAHSRHGVLNLDHHGQELTQLPGQTILLGLAAGRAALA